MASSGNVPILVKVSGKSKEHFIIGDSFDPHIFTCLTIATKLFLFATTKQVAVRSQLTKFTLHVDVLKNSE